MELGVTNRPMRVGIVDTSRSEWTAGAVYVSTLARSMASAADPSRHELTLFAGEGLVRTASSEGWGLRTSTVATRGSYVPGPSRFGRLARIFHSPRTRLLLRLKDSHDAISLARRSGAHVVLPVTSPRSTGGAAGIGWIPDFQHRYLPEFFGETERRARDRTYKRVAERCRLILLSSEASRADFRDFVPELADKARVASFPSVIAFGGTPTMEADVRDKYGLPPRFALVVNQFWGHKNHALVIEAVSRVATGGITIPLVLVGRPADYRDPTNSVVSDLLQRISRSTVRDQIWMLGEVARSELLELMRVTALAIQPSLFEGWSTSVQDFKALGRPMLCADIPVLREQAPRALGFFDPRDPDALSALLEEVWPGLEAGPDPESEADALREERRFAAAYGKRLLEVCDEALVQ